MINEPMTTKLANVEDVLLVGDRVFTSRDIKNLLTELTQAKHLINDHGICEKCGDMYSHELDAPFASCGCNTSEWYSLTPFMQLEESISDLAWELKAKKDTIKEMSERCLTAAEVAAIRAEVVLECQLIVAKIEPTYRENPGMGFNATIEDKDPRQFKKEVMAQLGVYAVSIRQEE